MTAPSLQDCGCHIDLEAGRMSIRLPNCAEVDIQKDPQQGALVVGRAGVVVGVGSPRCTHVVFFWALLPLPAWQSVLSTLRSSSTRRSRC